MLLTFFTNAPDETRTRELQTHKACLETAGVIAQHKLQGTYGFPECTLP